MRELPFVIIVQDDPEDGGYIATTPSLAGVVGQGNTKQEAISDIKDALEFTVDDMLENGEPLPEYDEFSRPPEASSEEYVEIKVAV